MSQSSNDVIPTAIKISAHIDLTKKLYPALDKLINEIQTKAKSLKVSQNGRTHLMDAMPIDFSDELLAWSSQLSACRNMLEVIEERFLELPQGGTAVGSGINAHKQFAKFFAQEMSKILETKRKYPKQSFFHEPSAHDCSVQLQEN